MKHIIPPENPGTALTSKLVRAFIDATPASVCQLSRMTGLSNTAVRNAIDGIRACGDAVWCSRSGFWADGSPSPSAPTGIAGGSLRWKKEPPATAAGQR